MKVCSESRRIGPSTAAVFRRRRGAAPWLVAVCLLAGAALWSQEALRAEVAIESQDLFVGEPAVFQITVNASNDIAAPDITAAAADFTVEVLGPRSNSSTQVSIVNGQVTRSVRHETILAYRLTPRRAGLLQIAAMTVRAGGREAITQAVPVRVRPADQGAAHEGMALRMDLSRDTVTVGEPVTVTWTWSISNEVRGFEFALPLFELPDVDLPKVEPVLDPQRRDRYVGIRAPDGRQLVALQTARRSPAGQTIDIVFSQVLIPRQPGQITLPGSTVVCEVFAPNATPGRRRGPFSNPLFDDPFMRQGSYRRAAVASNAPVLTVKPLPEAGRPADFAGHVGAYRLRVTAEPTEVNVGDPITLTLELSGPEFLEPVPGPDLEHHEDLARDFRISPPEPGLVEDGRKVFKRILRARHADVTRIPALRLPYFDTAAEAYRVAESEPIPVTVRAVRVVTAMDAEGATATASDAGRRLQAWSRGIAANYEDLAALTDQHVGPEAWLHSPLWAASWAVPPLLWALALTGATAHRRRHADPAARRARQAVAQARRALRAAAVSDDAAPTRILEALREYLGAKLRLSSGALVFGDVEEPLRQRGVSADDRQALKALFTACEAGRYAAGLGAETTSAAELAASARRLLESMERTLNGC